MKVLTIGGAGYVGQLVLPRIAADHEVRIFDLVAPPPGPWSHALGSVTDYSSVRAAMAGNDAAVYMAMNSKADWGDLPSVETAYDVNVKGVALSLRAAGECGVAHVVLVSSMSVYAPRERYPDESVPPDAVEFYGLTKRLGEEVAKSAVATGGPSVTALRLCFPIPDDAAGPGPGRFRAVASTRASDVAGAILAALEYRHGFEAFTISGDANEEMTVLGKARARLGWTPTGLAGATDG